jgi:hypothetical protein
MHTMLQATGRLLAALVASALAIALVAGLAALLNLSRSAPRAPVAIAPQPAAKQIELDRFEHVWVSTSDKLLWHARPGTTITPTLPPSSARDIFAVALDREGALWVRRLPGNALDLNLDDFSDGLNPTARHELFLRNILSDAPIGAPINALVADGTYSRTMLLPDVAPPATVGPRPVYGRDLGTAAPSGWRNIPSYHRGDRTIVQDEVPLPELPVEDMMNPMFHMEMERQPFKSVPRGGIRGTVAVPEPTSCSILLIALGGFAARRPRRK